MESAEQKQAALAVNPWLIALVVSLAAFMEVLDTTITNVSLSHIAGTLGATQDESTWVLTSYLVANGIVLPLSGWLSGALGRKRFFMVCIFGFTAASFACGVSQSLVMLIICRLIQGLAGGGLQPTQQAIILDVFPPEKRGVAFGLTGITMIVAPILGPTLGGWITDNWSWQWIFFMNVPVGALAFWLVGRLVEDPPHAQAKGLVSIDYLGLSLVALGLGTLQVMLDKGQQEDWFASNFIIALAIVAVSCLSMAIARLLSQEDPIIDLRLMKLPSFGLSCMMMFFTGYCLYAGSTLLPLLLQSEFGYDATLAGLVLSPGGFAVIFLMPVIGRMVNYVPARYLIAIGMALCATGMWQTSHLSPNDSYEVFVFYRILQVIGLPFLFIPISTLAFMQIPKEKSSKASAVFAMSRNMGGSIGIAITISYVARHQQMHQVSLSQHLSNADIGYRNLLSHVHGAGESLKAGMGKIYHVLLQQSDLLAVSDAFALMAAIMGTLALVALIMPHNDPHTRQSAAAAGAH